MNHRGKKGAYKEHNGDGTPLCPGKITMVYCVTEKKNMTNKFRCPKPAVNRWSATKNAGVSSSYGYVKRVFIKENPCMFCSPHRGSRTFGVDNAFTDVMICLITFLAATMVQIQ